MPQVALTCRQGCGTGRIENTADIEWQAAWLCLTIDPGSLLLQCEDATMTTHRDRTIHKRQPGVTSDTPKRLRKSDLFLSVAAANILVLILIACFSFFRISEDLPSLERQTAMVNRLELTDLCLFTEARYVRNPSQADLHSAFQDYPMSLDHFPAGSLVTPPASLRKTHVKMD